jgi:uncharacterized delta-60 repeat protein
LDISPWENNMNRLTVRLLGMLGTVCGLTATQVAVADTDPFVCRFTAGGFLDTNFGTQVTGQGCLRWDAGPNVGTNDEYYDVKVDPAGRIVACGSYTNTNGTKGFLMARYLSSGLPDFNFGPQGSGFVQQSWGGAQACATDTAGRIVIAIPFSGSSGGILVRRFTANGSVDSTFGPPGTGYEWIPTVSPTVTDLEITSNGLIWIAGQGGGFRVARLTANGVRDTSFGTAGVATGAWTITSALAVDGTGGVVLAVTNFSGGDPSKMGAVRLTAQGGLDTAFNTNAAVIDFPGFSGATSAGVVIDSTGTIVLGGYAFVPSRADFAVARLQTSGLVGARHTTLMQAPWGAASEIALTSNNRVILAGIDAPGLLGSGHRRVTLARYAPNGIDQGFGIGGVAIHDFVTANADVTGLAVDTTGRPIVVGYTSP